MPIAIPMSDNRSSCERNIALLDVEFKSKVWQLAAQVHGEGFDRIIAQSFLAWTRHPLSGRVPCMH